MCRICEWKKSERSHTSKRVRRTPTPPISSRHGNYEWIQLHNGIMPTGLTQQELCVQSTKYYAFPEGKRHPDIEECSYHQTQITRSYKVPLSTSSHYR